MSVQIAANAWLDPEAAAEFIGFKPRTLANWRNLGKGPKYSKPNGYHVRYRVSDLTAWAAMQARSKS